MNEQPALNCEESKAQESEFKRYAALSALAGIALAATTTGIELIDQSMGVNFIPNKIAVGGLVAGIAITWASWAGIGMIEKKESGESNSEVN